jgi:hypothetical protein
MNATIALEAPTTTSSPTLAEGGAGAVRGAPGTLLRLEGAAALIGATLAFSGAGGRWSTFALLFLLPDLSMLGYLAGRRVGAASYNAAHSYVGAALVTAVGLASGTHGALLVACVWAAHVGFDRLLGYGLKYGTSFGDTHLGHRSPPRARRVAAVGTAVVLMAASDAFAAPPSSDDTPVAPAPETHGFNPFPTHHFQLAPSDAKNLQVGVNFGLLQIAEGGFNVAAEVRYRRWWLEYSHGMDLTMNDLGGIGLSSAERSQGIHVFVPYTTGFGVGLTLVDELWLGVEFKTHRYDVNAPGGPVASYQTYSVGPVLGYKAFIWKGLYANAYARYWPNVASSLDDGKLALQGSNGSVTHTAHDFGLFANASIGYAFDL